MNKKSLRRMVREKKRAMREAQIREKSDALARRFLGTEAYRNARSLYGYCSYNQEVRTFPVLEQALRDGKRVAVPKCYGPEMRFIWITDLNNLEKNAMGIPEPMADEPVADDETALVLVPGLVFDPAGNRIGYGGGYYDRFLAREPEHPTIALCFDFQITDRLETDEYDVPVDMILWA